jgi:hypothetical protein
VRHHESLFALHFFVLIPFLPLSPQVDIFAINQHNPDLRDKDLSQLQAVVEKATHVLLVSDEEAKPLKRYVTASTTQLLWSATIMDTSLFFSQSLVLI